MIHSRSLGLIIDTGILLDIMRLRPDVPLFGAMFEWVCQVVSKTMPPPKGRIITVFVSSGVYRGYKAGMGIAGTGAVAPSWNSFRRSTFKKAIDAQNKTFFSIQHVSADQDDGGGWKGDRFDRPFFTLLAAAGSARAWNDRSIVFASRDSKTLEHMRDVMLHQECRDRVHFAGDLYSCEDMIVH